jgi:hypothetical protein
MSELRHRLLIGGLVAAAGVALFFGVRATETGDGEPGSPSKVVEHFIPGEGDSVIRQSELGVDLAPGYEGALVINGVEIPTEDLRLVPEQNQVFFTPGEGKAVEQLRAGLNCVEAEAWKSADGRGTANDRFFTWCFEAL